MKKCAYYLREELSVVWCVDMGKCDVYLQSTYLLDNFK